MIPKRNDSAHHLDFSARGDSPSDDDPQVNAYVEEFKREIEEKFEKSRMNQTYCFPRRSRSKSRKPPVADSPESLKDVLFYDLESQNVKHRLQLTAAQRRQSISEDIVEMIKGMGQLDGRYLRSQFSSPRSPFFKMLHKSLNDKLEQHSACPPPRSFLLAEFRPPSTRSTVKAEKKALQLTELLAGQPGEFKLPPSSYHTKVTNKAPRSARAPSSPHAHNFSHNVGGAKRLRPPDQNKTVINAKTLKSSQSISATKKSTLKSQSILGAEPKSSAHKSICRTRTSLTGKQVPPLSLPNKAAPLPLMLKAKCIPKLVDTLPRDPTRRRENFKKFLAKESSKNA